MASNVEYPSDHDKSSREIEREIGSVRESLDHTLEELEARLSPGQLLDQAVGYLRRNGAPEFARNFGRSINENPLPVAMTAASLAWLMYSSSHPHGNGYGRTGDGESVGERVRDAAGRAGSAITGAREKGGQAAERAMRFGADAAERARSVRGAAGRRSSQLRHGVERTLEEDPLLSGVASFALGALFGALLPPTQTEDETFGEARDRTLESAARAGVEKTHEAAEVVQEKAREAGRQQRGESGPGERRSPGASGSGIR